MIPTRRFGVGAGGGDHGDAALYLLIAAVKAVRSLVSDLVIPFCAPLPLAMDVAEENAECRYMILTLRYSH